MSKKRELTDVEKAERQLAEMVANARSRGLKWTMGAYWRGADGTPANYSLPPDVAACCAVGAYALSHDNSPNKAEDLLPSGTVSGNDYGGGFGEGLGLGVNIGAAYRDIMLEEAGAL